MNGTQIKIQKKTQMEISCFERFAVASNENGSYTVSFPLKTRIWTSSSVTHVH